MKISLIVVLDLNNGIGKNNKLLCHLPADLKRFKQLTTGNSIVMGRKTFESLPNGTLPNRRNIVLSRDKNYKAEGCDMVHSVDEIFQLHSNEEKVFIIGGEQVYKLFIEKADILHITQINHQFEADAFFPEFQISEWNLDNKIENHADEKNKFSYSFIDYSRKSLSS